jgi:hypothetical protein
MTLEIENRTAFMTVWTALNQFVENAEECNECEPSAELQAQIAEARALVEKLDAVVAAAAR